MEQCPKCGRKIEGDAIFCPGCGERIVPEFSSEMNESATAVRTQPGESITENQPVTGGSTVTGTPVEQKKKSMMPLVIILSAAGGAAALILIIFFLRSFLFARVNKPVVKEAEVEEVTREVQPAPEKESASAPDPAEEEVKEEPLWYDKEGIHRYELVISDASWSEAFEECLAKGGYLAHINSQEEFAFVTARIRQEDKTDITFWLGGSRDNPSDGYRWINPDRSVGDEPLDAEENMGYWLPGEPSYAGDDEEGVMQKETCIDLLHRSSDDRFYWNDVPEDVIATAPYLSGKFGYICEYEDTEGSASDNYETLILGAWDLPGSNRMYMNFQPDGTVFGYEYMDDSYWIEGDTLIINSSYYEERRYFTITQLDQSWLGLLETDSTGMPLYGDEVVYGYRNDSPEWYTDPALEIQDFGNWILKDMNDDGLDGEWKGLYFNDGCFELFYGEPDLMLDGNIDWTMAATYCPGALIARDGKMDVYYEPGKVSLSYDYRIEGDTLFVRDSSGEHEFYKKVNHY